MSLICFLILSTSGTGLLLSLQLACYCPCLGLLNVMCNISLCCSSFLMPLTSSSLSVWQAWSSCAWSNSLWRRRAQHSKCSSCGTQQGFGSCPRCSSRQGFQAFLEGTHICSWMVCFCIMIFFKPTVFEPLLDTCRWLHCCGLSQLWLQGSISSLLCGLVRWQLVGYHQLCVAWACIDHDSPILRFMSQICLCCMKSLEVSSLKQKKMRFFLCQMFWYLCYTSWAIVNAAGLFQCMRLKCHSFLHHNFKCNPSKCLNRLKSLYRATS